MRRPQSFVLHTDSLHRIDAAFAIDPHGAGMFADYPV